MGINDRGWYKIGYKLLSNKPTIINSEMLIPTDNNACLMGSVCFNLDISKIRNPGTVVKNKKVKNGLKKGILKIIDRSVNNSRIITINTEF